MEPIKVLVVDDTIVYRKIVSDALSEIPGIQIVGTANNGKIALSRISSLKPDIITLDIEMPEMSGIEVLEQLQALPQPPTAVMLSTLTHKGSEMTIRALELGAFDFIAKPDQGTMKENFAYVKSALKPIISAFLRQRVIREKLRGKITGRPAVQTREPARTPIAPTKTFQRSRTTPSEIIGIGISTGGPNALAAMMPKLSGSLNVPVLIVQHMPPLFTQSLAKSLDAKCSLRVKEAEHGEPLVPNTAYIAPGGKQMKIIAGPDGRSRNICITDDPPENSCKPSADYLFRSIAEHYVGRATGVIMTGMGSDGTKGLQQMKKNGAIIIAQNQETCTVYGMPKEPVESGLADVVSPLEEIADSITKTVR